MAHSPINCESYFFITQYLFYCCVNIFKAIYILDEHTPNKMTAQGVMKFLEDLRLDPEHRLVLIIAWKFQAAHQCEFTKEEFVTGMVDMGSVL